MSKGDVQETKMEKATRELNAELASFLKPEELESMEVLSSKGHKLVVKGPTPSSPFGFADWWFGQVGLSAAYVAFTMNLCDPGIYPQRNCYHTFERFPTVGEVVTFSAVAKEWDTIRPKLEFRATAFREKEVVIARGSCELELKHPVLPQWYEQQSKKKQPKQ
ncbi:hypothetical protein B9Z55_008542 [Caenorhabditis nigoni]|uniref:MaoC-like domain-containing protein n=1 Tax=Caenorhabditis nigoni TaxID=1611254 RepID=A0A2G5UNN9_9PELO|nr:hypothetical protein B9Z55_008542 [Caenorhabditis nigoni]